LVVTDFHHDLDTERLNRFMGARRNAQMSAGVERRVDSLRERVDELVDPRVNFLLVSVKRVERGRVVLEDGTSFKSPKVARTLKDARRVCSFVATIGPMLEKEVDHLMAQNRYADAFVLDAMASLTVEDVVEQFHRGMARRLAEMGQAVTLRFSPGYCDWPLPEQAVIFDQFTPDVRLEVTLNDAFLMTPQKSVSGVFGVLNYPAGLFADYNPCDHCSKTDCIARR
jgi:hypothetical protein